MGFRCSLLGHKYGDTEVERDREERGEEVVIITREYRVCELCGERDLVSENKEVTTEQTADAEPQQTDAATDTAETPTPPTETAETTDTTSQMATPASETATAKSAERDTDSGAEPPTEEDAGIILDDDTDDEGPPEWPDPTVDDEEDVSVAAESWPEPSGEDTGISATGPTDSQDPDVDYAGLNPTRTDSEILDTQSATAASTEENHPAETTDTQTAAVEVDTPPQVSRSMTLVCSECGFTDESGQGSLRRGDICPGCLDGYLVAAERNK